MEFLHELKFAARSLARAKGLFATVVLTLALGIGVNTAIFGLVRSVLLRPLVNRDEARLIYVRQSAPGINAPNIMFSVPEIQDLRERVKGFTSIGEFSTVAFSMVGLGEPRQVRAGVVSGNYFSVMGLQPVLGRLLTESDDGRAAAGAAVLTHRFWTTALQSDPSVIGKTIRLDTRSATIVGVVEPSVPYPAETELIANIVTSPHHLSATMVQGREHRMTEVFGRLSPASNLEAIRAELAQAHGSITAEHPEAYPPRAGFGLRAVPLRDELTSKARGVLIVLMAASLLIFAIACSNVANLILARTLRRESELTVRAALGAHSSDLRRTLLAESVLLCGSGALLGIAIAWPMVSLLSRYASRFSVRALEMTVDANLLWVGAGLALVAALLLAFVPKLPSADRIEGLKLSGGSVRIAGGARRRLHAFAVTQIGASFVLLAGAVMLLNLFLTLQAASPGFEPSQVLAVNVPVTTYGRTPDQIREFYRQLSARTRELPGVEAVSVGSSVPWRDLGQFERANFTLQIEGEERNAGNDDARAKLRSVSPGYFATLGLPILSGRDFNADDRADAEQVVIVSESLARTLFSNRDVLNRHLRWTDGVMRFIGIGDGPRRIVGIVPDLDEEHLEPGPVMMVYHPFEQQMAGGRLFVQTRGDAHALVPAVTQIVRNLATDQPVEQAATLSDVRAEVLAPDRLNTLIFGSFASVALAIAVIGVAGVLALSVGARMKEFGIRLAIGSRPAAILTNVVSGGAIMAAAGIASGVVGGFVIARVAARYLEQVQLPGVMALVLAGGVLLLAALAASIAPAARAARVNVIDVLRAD